MYYGLSARSRVCARLLAIHSGKIVESSIERRVFKTAFLEQDATVVAWESILAANSNKEVWREGDGSTFPPHTGQSRDQLGVYVHPVAYMQGILPLNVYSNVRR